jgi:hypothetical protein
MNATKNIGIKPKGRKKKKREPKCKTVGRYRQIKINKRTSQMSGCTESLIGNKIPNKIDL